MTNKHLLAAAALILLVSACVLVSKKLEPPKPIVIAEASPVPTPIATPVQAPSPTLPAKKK